ncbi:MAG: hypothetical protein O7F76_03135 [Planctomycetota bacterium]|nr:hypothetical protein [Planctomycetota bacterium]
MSITERQLKDFIQPDDALAALWKTFESGDPPGPFETVESAAVPVPFDDLLVHHRHMTTTLESFHKRPVELRVLQHKQDGDLYSREILLTLSGTDRVVEFGIVQLDLGLVSDAVRAQIMERQTPLGDILIRHNVLRRIEPRWYFRFFGDCPLLRHFGPEHPSVVYGRVGTIYCDHEPAIELLEVVSNA